MHMRESACMLLWQCRRQCCIQVNGASHHTHYAIAFLLEQTIIIYTYMQHTHTLIYVNMLAVIGQQKQISYERLPCMCVAMCCVWVLTRAFWAYVCIHVGTCTNYSRSLIRTHDMMHIYICNAMQNRINLWIHQYCGAYNNNNNK